MKKQQKVERPVLADGWFWVRLFVPLRGGHYHHSWEPARIQNGMVQLFGSSTFKPADAPVLENALWRGPISPPPLEEPASIALALERVSSRLKRKNRIGETPAQDTRSRSDKVLVLARGIATAFVETSDDLRAMYAEAPDKLEEVVQQVAWLIERFGV